MKKYLKKLLCSIFAISILLVSTIHVDAATPYKAISKKTKVGNYYIWPNSEKGIYVSKSNKLSPKKIVSKPKSSDTYITETLVTNGSKIYYGIGFRKLLYCFENFVKQLIICILFGHHQDSKEQTFGQRIMIGVRRVVATATRLIRKALA